MVEFTLLEYWVIKHRTTDDMTQLCMKEVPGVVPRQGKGWGRSENVSELCKIVKFEDSNLLEIPSGK